MLKSGFLKMSPVSERLSTCGTIIGGKPYTAMQAAYMTSNLSPHKMTQSLLRARGNRREVGERVGAFGYVFLCCVQSWVSGSEW